MQLNAPGGGAGGPQTRLHGEILETVSTLANGITTVLSAGDVTLTISLLGPRNIAISPFIESLGIDPTAISATVPIASTRIVNADIDVFSGTDNTNQFFPIPLGSMVTVDADVITIVITGDTTPIFNGVNLSRLTYNGLFTRAIGGDIEVLGSGALTVDFHPTLNRITVDDQRQFSDVNNGEGFATQGETYIARPPVGNLQRDTNQADGLVEQFPGGVRTTVTPSVDEITADRAELDFTNVNRLLVVDGPARGQIAEADDEFTTRGQMNDALAVRDVEIAAIARILTTAITDTEVPERYENFRLRPAELNEQGRVAALNHMRQYRIEGLDTEGADANAAAIFERAHALTPRNDGPNSLNDFNRFGLHMTLSALNRGDYRTDLGNVDADGNPVRTIYPTLFNDNEAFPPTTDNTFSIQQYSAANALDFRVLHNPGVFNINSPIQDISQPSATQRALFNANHDFGQLTGYPGLIRPAFGVQVQQNFGVRSDGSVSSIPDNHRGIVSAFRFTTDGNPNQNNVLWSVRNQGGDNTHTLEMGYFEALNNSNIDNDGWYFVHTENSTTEIYTEVLTGEGSEIDNTPGKAFSMIIVLADYQRRRASDGTHRRVRIHYAVAELQPDNRGTSWNPLENFRRIDTFINAEEANLGLVGTTNPIIQFGIRSPLANSVTGFQGVISEVMVGYTDFSTFNLSTGEQDNQPGLARFLTHGGAGGSSENLGAYLTTNSRYYGLLNVRNRMPIAIERTNILSVRVDEDTIRRVRSAPDQPVTAIRIPFEPFGLRPTPTELEDGGATWQRIHDAGGVEYVRPANEIWLRSDDSVNSAETFFGEDFYFENIRRGDLQYDPATSQSGSRTSINFISVRETANHNLSHDLTGGHPESEITQIRVATSDADDGGQNYIEVGQDFYDSERRTIVNGNTATETYEHGQFGINIYAIHNDAQVLRNTSWTGDDRGFNVSTYTDPDTNVLVTSGSFIFPQLSARYTSDRNPLNVDPQTSHLRLNFYTDPDPADLNAVRVRSIREATISNFNPITGQIDWEFRTDAQLGAAPGEDSVRNDDLPAGVMDEPLRTVDDRFNDTGLDPNQFFVNIIENASIPDVLTDILGIDVNGDRVIDPNFSDSTVDPLAFTTGDTFPASPESGAFHFLTADVVGTGDTDNPQFPGRMYYRYDGTLWAADPDQSSRVNGKRNIRFVTQGRDVGAFIDNNISVNSVRGGIAGSDQDSLLRLNTNDGDVVLRAGTIGGVEGSVNINSDVVVGTGGQVHGITVNGTLNLNLLQPLQKASLFLGTPGTLENVSTLPATLTPGTHTATPYTTGTVTSHFWPTLRVEGGIITDSDVDGALGMWSNTESIFVTDIGTNVTTQNPDIQIINLIG